MTFSAHPEPVEGPVTIGPATLYCGDAYSIRPTLGWFDADVLDPPYLIRATGAGRYRKRRARPMTRHPRLLEAIGEVLPRAKGRPGARLREDLRLDDAEIAALATALEEACDIRIDRRDADEWETLNDVTDTIAAAQYCEPA